jgi:DNA-binding response OmpR family regulator
MSVLIVANNDSLGQLWCDHLLRQAIDTHLVFSADTAIEALNKTCPDLIVLDLDLPGGKALCIADYANFRFPEARVVFVTNSRFFSDGSIFNHASNACAYIPASTPLEDLSAIVQHYAELR